MTKRYEIVDHQIGHTYFRTDNYDLAARMFFAIWDREKRDENDTYLLLVDTTINRAISVVVS